MRSWRRLYWISAEEAFCIFFLIEYRLEVILVDILCKSSYLKKYKFVSLGRFKRYSLTRLSCPNVPVSVSELSWGDQSNCEISLVFQEVLLAEVEFQVLK